MSTDSWRVLLVDTDKGDRLAVRQALQAAAPGIHLDEAAQTTEVDAALPPPGEAYDCLIVRGDAAGVALIAALRGRGIKTPILAVTEPADQTIEDAALAAGASDYLPRQTWQPARLVRRLGYAIRVGRTEASYASAVAAANRAAHDRDELLAIVSHDLRSPLNAIRIAADELIDPSLPDDERKIMVGAVQRSLRRADRLISDLLDVSRLEAGGLTLSFTPVSAKELVEQGRSENAVLTKNAGLDLQLQVDHDLGLVMADRERILQVLGNLLSNAVRHARGSGVVTLSARNQGEQVEISVTDNGPGIPADRLSYLFDRFAKARQQHRAGTGLGLAIAKGIISAHGGTIGATSTLGKGSRFTFTLPRAY